MEHTARVSVRRVDVTRVAKVTRHNANVSRDKAVSVKHAGPIKYARLGVPGPPGPKGDKGDTGPSGSGGSDAYYKHDQHLADILWTINHNLGKHPAIQPFDTTGRPIIANIEHVNDNTALLHLNAASAGTAECN